jgi:uncharacterized OB-fold protein
MSAKELVYPPRVTPFTARFWDGLREGKFMTTKCRDCAYMTFPPKPICPECWKDNLEWVELSGKGTLTSYTQVLIAPQMFADEAPYTLCIVDLDEGVRLVSRILEDWDALAPDCRVRVKTRQAEPTYIYDFVLDRDVEGDRA